MGNPNDPYAPMGETPAQKATRETNDQNYKKAWATHIKETSKPVNTGGSTKSGK